MYVCSFYISLCHRSHHTLWVSVTRRSKVQIMEASWFWLSVLDWCVPSQGSAGICNRHRHGRPWPHAVNRVNHLSQQCNFLQWQGIHSPVSYHRVKQGLKTINRLPHYKAKESLQNITVGNFEEMVNLAHVFHSNTRKVYSMPTHPSRPNKNYSQLYHYSCSLITL